MITFLGTHKSPRFDPKHIGVIGQRIEVRLTCTNIIKIPTVKRGHWDTGYVFLFICRDDDGNNVLYKGNASTFLALGESATFRATVVKHGEYRNVPQTCINRPTRREGKKA